MGYKSVQQEKDRRSKTRHGRDENEDLDFKPKSTSSELETKRFQRVEEDFSCENCGSHVKGSGYTNHCPNCLWSKHVDVNPGDRASDCGGMMEPVGLEVKGNEKIIMYKCTQCKASKRNKASKNDNVDALIKLSTGRLL